MMRTLDGIGIHQFVLTLAWMIACAHAQGGPSCNGFCDSTPNNGICWCDSLCTGSGDCCFDYYEECDDECASDPCSNGGTCTYGSLMFTCTCTENENWVALLKKLCVNGYMGDECQINIDECASSPCSNGGTCVDGVNMFTCTCESGYEGDTCEINIDECGSNPCSFGGLCFDGINNFTCSCVLGYQGDICEINIDECASSPCSNGGTCVDGVNMFDCTCETGYQGDTCQIIALFEFEKCLTVINEAANALLVRVFRKPNVGDALIMDTGGSVRVVSSGNIADFETRDFLLDFAPGDTVKTFTIRLLDDREPEDNETYSITLKEPIGGRLGDCSQSNVIVVDDDSLYTFEQDIYQVLESDGEVAVNVRRIGKNDVQGSVDVSILGTIAREGKDYRLINGNTVVFPPGSSNEIFRVAIIDDDMVEDVKTMELRLINPVNGYTREFLQVTMYIADNDAIFNLDVIPREILQSSESLFVTAIVSRMGYLQRSITIFLRTFLTQRTKRATDFTPMDIPVHFSPGQSVNEVQIDIREPFQLFSVEIYGLPDEAIGEQSEIDVTVSDDVGSNQDGEDDDMPPLFNIERNSYNVLESDKSVDITVVRSGNTDQPGSVLFYTGSYNDGVADNSDYRYTSVILQFDVGILRQTTSVKIIDDAIVEGAKRFWVGLREPLGGRIGDDRMATVFITDDEVFLSFQRTNYDISEDIDSLLVTVTRTGYNGPMTLGLNAENIDHNSAKEGEDYRIPDILTFPAGVHSVTLDVDIIDDNINELRETFEIQMTRNGDPVGIISVSITDDDDGDDINVVKGNGLSELSLLLIAVGGSLVLIGITAGIVLCALCMRRMRLMSIRQPTPVPQQFHMMQRYR